MLLIDPLSAVSRNHLTIQRSNPFPLQTGAEQVNSWHQRPFTTEILGVGLKNAYIGEPHVWESRSGEVGQIVSELFYWFNIPSSFSEVLFQEFLAILQRSQYQSRHWLFFCDRKVCFFSSSESKNLLNRVGFSFVAE